MGQGTNFDLKIVFKDTVRLGIRDHFSPSIQDFNSGLQETDARSIQPDGHLFLTANGSESIEVLIIPRMKRARTVIGVSRCSQMDF